MFNLSRQTARLAVVASFAALLTAACSPDSKDLSDLSGPTLSAGRHGDGGRGAATLSFTVLADAAVTCTDGTITGNIGTFQASPTGAVTLTTCPITGASHVGDAAAIQAYTAFLARYAALAPQPGDACPIITGTLGGQNLPPGVYCVSAEAKMGLLTLTGPASGSWTFKVAPGAFTGTSFSVVMAGGAQACNVTWWVDAAATMTDSDLKGTILSGAAITLTRGTSIGNAYANAGVTVTGTAVTGCASGGNGHGHGDHDDDDDCDEGHGKKGHHHKNHNEKGHHHKDKHDQVRGAARAFTVLGNAAVTCTDGTITGNVGTFLAVPVGAVTQTTCPIDGQIHVGDAAAIQAYNAFLSQYAALAPQAGDACPIITGTLAGQNLPPGVYCLSAEAKTGLLTLTGPASGTWTFKVAPGAFTGTNFSVVMAGGAQACNVTWWVDAATTMTDSDLKGTILSGAAITLTRGTLIGRALARADVTVTGTAVTGCAGSENGGGKDDCDEGHGDRGHRHKGHHERGHHHNDKHHDRDRDNDRDKHSGKDKDRSHGDRDSHTERRGS